MMIRNVLSLAVLAVFVTQPGCHSQDEDHATTVGKLVRARDFGRLVPLLTDANKDLRCRAAKGIAWARDPALLESYLKVIEMSECPWRVRAEVIWRIQETGADIGMPHLIALLKSDERRFRWNAAKALGVLGDRRALQALQECQSSREPYLAKWCVWAECAINTGGKCKEKKPDMRAWMTDGQADAP
jgi:HEAT repeat protein